MSELRINECGAYEREVEQNWAAAYAKRLVDQEETARDQAIAAAVGEEAAARVEAVAGEEAARAAKDNALADGTALENNCIYSRHIREGNVTTGKIHDGDVKRVKLAADAKITELITTSGDLQFRYGDNEHISYGSLSDHVISVFGLPIKDAAAQEWITNNCIIDTVEPPECFDEGFEPHDGLMYLQSDGLAIMKVFVLSGETALGVNVWKQIYPAMLPFTSVPQQIGFWENGGLPVWRAAIDHTLTSDEIEDAFYNKLDDITSDRSKVQFIINGHASLTQTVPSVVDFIECSLSSDGNLSWDPTAQSGSGYDHLVGYIDFACPAEYIVAE